MKVAVGTLTTVAILAVGLPLAILTYVHFAWAGPDVRQESKKAEAQRRHTSVASMMDRSLATVAGAAPHATRLASAIRDYCDNEVTSFGAKPQMRCSRTVTVYLAFDGDQAEVERAWAKSLAVADWTWSDSMITYQRFGSRVAGYPAVVVTWSTRPQPPYVAGNFAKGTPDKDTHDQVTLEQRPVDVAKLYQDAYVRHRYVADLEMSDHYY